MSGTQPLKSNLYNVMSLPKWFDALLRVDGTIIFIDGRRGNGKTDFGLKLAEYCYEHEYRKRIATNIKTDDYRIEQQISDLHSLNDWLLTPGKKTYLLDELGKNAGKKRFMTKQNVGILDIAQLIRHYDCLLIGISPKDIFVDTAFLDEVILDARINKKSLHKAKIKDFVHRKSITLKNVERTSIKFNSKDIADFTLQKKFRLEELPMCCKVAQVYGETGTYKAVREKLAIKNDETIHRLIQDHMKHSVLTTYRES